jgi:hypothetical protein
MEKSSQTPWKIVPLRHFFPLKVFPLIGVLLYKEFLECSPLHGSPARKAVRGTPPQGAYAGNAFVASHLVRSLILLQYPRSPARSEIFTGTNRVAAGSFAAHEIRSPPGSQTPTKSNTVESL